MHLRALLLLGAAACGASASSGQKPLELDVTGEWIDPEEHAPKRAAPVAPKPRPAPAPVVIRGATILTAAGRTIEDGTIVLEGGKIASLGGADLAAPAGATVIDAKGRFVTPGIIDGHSHIGVYPSTAGEADADGNEMSDVNTAAAAAEYAYLPQDPAITRALAGGVTAALVIPGSANLIGGRGVTVEMRPGRRLVDVRFPGAPPTLKMACGENPKRVHGEKTGPKTRMGELAAVRAAYRAAAEHAAKLAVYERKRADWAERRRRALEMEKKAPGGRVKPEDAPERPSPDLRHETLAAVLRGEILLQVHCYTARDIEQMVAAADELGLKIRAFHHALDAYKVRDQLAARDIAIATWADWWGFKLEALDGIPENAALFTESGGRASIHSDSAIGIQRLNQEAAKALAAGRAAGIQISDDQALRWITANPAWILGVDKVTGTLEPGKRADVVVWSAHPFSIYALADLVYISGELAHDRARGLAPSDFELGGHGYLGEVRR
jgi:imidazolonepropionase-like amidohydrolase